MNAVVALPFRVSWDRLCRQSSAIEARSRALLVEAMLAPELARHRAQGAASPVGAQPPCRLAAASPECPAAAADFS